MKRVFIVHKWGGKPTDDWYPWLKKELEKHGFKVIIPEMPDTDIPEINKWVSHLSREVGKADEETYFVGHSIGCPAIMRYAESLPKNARLGGAIFVAGWFTLKGLEGEEWDIAKPWLETPINCDIVKDKLPKSFALFSDNDKFVPLTDKETFKKKLGSKILVEHDKGHFTEKDKIKEIPIVLKELLLMAK